MKFIYALSLAAAALLGSIQASAQEFKIGPKSSGTLYFNQAAIASEKILVSCGGSASMNYMVVQLDEAHGGNLSLNFDDRSSCEAFKEAFQWSKSGILVLNYSADTFAKQRRITTVSDVGSSFDGLGIGRTNSVLDGKDLKVCDASNNCVSG